MRKSKTSALELEEQELAQAKHKEARKGGFTLMEIRDRGWGHLAPLYGSAQEVVMLWATGRDNDFKLIIKPYKGKTIEVVLDAEQVRKYLRWA